MDYLDIFNIKNEIDFTKIALKIFRFQAKNNIVYNEFINLLGVNVNDINSLDKIPFLPIQFFKTHKVVSLNKPIDKIFYSSGTTRSGLSKHYIFNIKVYEQSFIKGFNSFYGNIKDYNVLALLPNYLEQKNSSLVYMIDKLIKKANKEESGFYLNDLDKLAEKLIQLDKKGKKVLLIGVSFALLDLIEKYKFKLKNTIIMETGGMKGRRKEIVRAELHKLLKKGFGVSKIHSEYGMTELLSQAYSNENGLFKTPNWMKILIRDTEDALAFLPNNKTGGVNIIDLANINSCAFIATQDLGKVFSNDTFEILGRFDNSDIRGCNLMLI